MYQHKFLIFDKQQGMQNKYIINNNIMFLM